MIPQKEYRELRREILRRNKRDGIQMHVILSRSPVILNVVKNLFLRLRINSAKNLAIIRSRAISVRQL